MLIQAAKRKGTVGTLCSEIPVVAVLLAVSCHSGCGFSVPPTYRRLWGHYFFSPWTLKYGHSSGYCQSVSGTSPSLVPGDSALHPVRTLIISSFVPSRGNSISCHGFKDTNPFSCSQRLWVWNSGVTQLEGSGMRSLLQLLILKFTRGKPVHLVSQI